MFQLTSPQSSVFEVESMLPGALPENDWAFIFRGEILPLIDEEAFRPFYAEEGGRPNAPIRTMVSQLIFMGLEKLTFREAEYLFRRRLDWLIATDTPYGTDSVDHTTLFKFYQRLEGHQVAKQLFTNCLDAFLEASGISVKRQRTDSFFAAGWLRTLSRYGLFRETIEKFLRALRKQKPGLYEDISKELSQDYLDGGFDLTEKDKERAQKKVAVMAHDLYLIKCTFVNHKQVKHYETFKVLCQVFDQQCEVRQTAEQDPEIVIKEKPDPDTICTPHNPDARYVRKGKQRVTGDKVVVTETCDEDNKMELITDVDVVQITTPDSKVQGDIQQRLIENDLKPETQYADAGFVTGQTILASEQEGIHLEGPVAGRSQSFEKFQSTDRPLDPADFDVQLDQSGDLVVVACPNQQVAKGQKRSEKTGDLIVHFDADVCRACPLQPRCPVSVGTRVASFRVDEAQYAGALRHHRYMQDEGYRKQCAVRAGVEATVSELTRAHGARRSRHRKPARTQLQMIFAALACNVKRFIRYTQQCACPEPATA